MVMKTANTPRRYAPARTTTMERPAMVMVMMNSMASPCTSRDGAELGLGHLGEGLALMLRRRTAPRCRAPRPPMTQPISSQRSSAGSRTGRPGPAHQGPAAAMAAKCWPKLTHSVVGIVLAIFQLVGGVTILSSARSTLRTKNTP